MPMPPILRIRTVRPRLAEQCGLEVTRDPDGVARIRGACLYTGGQQPLSFRSPDVVA